MMTLINTKETKKKKKKKGLNVLSIYYSSSFHIS